MTTNDRTGPAGLVWTYAVTDFRLLWRHRTPVVFFFAVPAVLYLMLGPGISGSVGQGAAGRSLLGLAVMFSFMTTNYVGVALFREFVDNTWVLQALHRPPRTLYLLGKALPVMGMGLVQLALFGVVAFGVLGLPLHGDVLQLVLVAVVLIAFAAVLGALLYNLTSLLAVFQSISYLLVIVLGGIGGAIEEPTRLPLVSRVLSPFTPVYWALRALRESTVGTGSWTTTLQALAVLGTGTVLVGFLAVTMLDYRRARTAAA
jgi:ABC-2 type transport system permease protein